MIVVGSKSMDGWLCALCTNSVHRQNDGTVLFASILATHSRIHYVQFISFCEWSEIKYSLAHRLCCHLCLSLGTETAKAVYLELAVHNNVVHTDNLLFCFHLFDANFYCVFLIFERSNCFEQKNFAFVLNISGLTHSIQNQNNFSILEHTVTLGGQSKSWLVAGLKNIAFLCAP